MKSQAYNYEEEGVRLAFSFKEDEKLKSNKQIFLELLKEAQKDLEEELN